MSKFKELLELAMNPDVLVHQQVHNQLLRQLLDAATFSSAPPTHGFYRNQRTWEIEVDFND